MIVFGFSKPKSKFKIGAKIIQFAENSSYSHVYIMWKSESINRILIYQASGHGGVNFMNIDNFFKNNIVIKEYYCHETEIEKTLLMQYCIDHAGEDYGYLQLIGIAYYRLMAFFKKKVSNPFPHGQVCSEVAVSILRNIFNVISTDLDQEISGPKDVDNLLYKLCLLNPEKWEKDYGCI